jgi:hypothetical protein
MTDARYFITERGSAEPMPKRDTVPALRVRLENANGQLATAVDEILFLRAELAKRDGLIKELIEKLRP